MTLRLAQRLRLLDLGPAVATQLLIQPGPDVGVLRVVMPGQFAADLDIARQRGGQRREWNLGRQESALRAQALVISRTRGCGAAHPNQQQSQYRRAWQVPGCADEKGSHRTCMRRRRGPRSPLSEFALISVAQLLIRSEELIPCPA